MVYYAVNKPSGYLCTNRDEHGRRTVVSLVADKRHRRLYTVGRLDEESEAIRTAVSSWLDGSLATRSSGSPARRRTAWAILGAGMANVVVYENASNSMAF